MIKGLKFPKRRPGLDISVPAPDADKLQIKRVGVLACVGFAVGVLWPRLAGLQFVPAAPVPEVKAATSAQPTQGAAASASPSQSPALVKGKPTASDIADSSGGDRIVIRSVEVTSCQTRSGGTIKDCDEPDIASIATDRIKALKDCDGTRDARGVLSLGLEVDFKENKVARVLRGKSTTLPSGVAKRLSACARTEFNTATFDGVDHEHESYMVFHIVEFLSPSEVRPSEGDEVKETTATAASGRATVGWQVALIRAEPEEGEVVARLLSGTNVIVTARKGDWYKVRYDAKGNEGWVFKAAIGL